MLHWELQEIYPIVICPNFLGMVKVTTNILKFLYIPSPGATTTSEVSFLELWAHFDSHLLRRKCSWSEWRQKPIQHSSRWPKAQRESTVDRLLWLCPSQFHCSWLSIYTLAGRRRLTSHRSHDCHMSDCLASLTMCTFLHKQSMHVL